jgi:hypothetical protein
MRYSRSTLCAVLEMRVPGGFLRRTYLRFDASISWYVGLDWPNPNYSIVNTEDHEQWSYDLPV